MVSQGSNCDADGIPGYMQDVSSEFQACAEDCGLSSLVGDANGKVRSGVLGNIPLVVSDGESASDEAENIVESDMERMERITVNRAVKAAFDTNKNDRDELVALRNKMMELRAFLETKGLSMASVESEILKKKVEFNGDLGGSSSFIYGRDEYGLPIFTKSKNLEEKEGIKRSSPVNTNVTSKVFEDMPKPTAGVSGSKNTLGMEIKDDKVDGNEKLPAKSWVNVIKSDPCTFSSNNVKFDYCPLPKGVEVVEPPEEILLKGAEKYKCCVVGQFSRGTLPFQKVQSIAKVA